MANSEAWYEDPAGPEWDFPDPDPDSDLEEQTDQVEHDSPVEGLTERL